MKGFYHNENNEIVYCGSRKSINPEGLTWVNGHVNEWPKRLKVEGDFTSLYNGNAIVENPEYTTAKEDSNTENAARKIAKDNSGLKNITIEQAENFIDNQFDGATTIAAVREATKIVLKKMLPFII